MFSNATKESARHTKDMASQDLRNDSKGAKSDLNKTAEDAVDNISQFANEAGHAVRDFIDTTSNKIGATSEAVTENVQNKPIASLMIAAGVGFVLGMLFRGK